ncbi:ankyrin [Xylariaceae sp. AK1471]|nr:ankyrin [Xylariaceae sp. AK1471]
MPFSSFPNEVIHCILVLAVRARSTKRAVRLRLVSRAWNATVEYAIFDSGILDEDKPITRAAGLRVDLAFLQRYLTYRALHNTKPLSHSLAMIRQVAECIIEMRGVDADESQTKKALTECASEICHATIMFRGACGDLVDCLVPAAEPIARFNRDARYFQLSLLATAAYTNDLVLTRQLLSETNWDVRYYAYPVLFDPYDAAAYKGNEEILSCLLANEKTINRGRDPRLTIIWTAPRGNQMGAIELALSSVDFSSPKSANFQKFLDYALSSTTSVDVFRRCFELVNGHLQHPSRPSDIVHLQERLLRWFCKAARRGAVALMEHLAQLGASVNGCLSDEENKFLRPISLAAIKGHEHAVKWLLDRGAALDCSLHAAVVHGSISIVQLLLEHGAIHDHGTVQRALLEAVKTENETLFRLLMTHGARLDKAIIEKATEIVEIEQLESIKKLLQEHSKTTDSQND